MMRATTWIQLGSANVIDWRYLGRTASVRGATAWIGQLEGEPVVVRAFGEDTTSTYEFVLLTDERVAGSIVVQSSRTDGNLLRIQTTVEVEGAISIGDVCDFRENPKTLLLTFLERKFEAREGNLTESRLEPISAAAAELFEIAPDSAMQTVCAEWIASAIAAARDSLRGKVVRAEQVERRANVGARVESPGLRGREVVVRPANGRDLNDSEPPRRPIIEVVREPSSDIPVRDRSSPRTVEKLVCSTNTGERFEIQTKETFIGRSKQCEIVLKSARVSRKHACVTKENDGFYINDVGAANGIWNGSTKIDRERIGNGDQFVIGDVVLSFSYG